MTLLPIQIRRYHTPSHGYNFGKILKFQIRFSRVQGC